MSKIAVIGRFFRTVESAEEYLLNQSLHFQDSHTIMQLSEGCLIIGKQQAKLIINEEIY